MNIEAMAREAGGAQMIPAVPDVSDAEFVMATSDLSRFAALVRAEAMREAAGICQRDALNLDQFRDASSDCAAAILAAIDQPKEK